MLKINTVTKAVIALVSTFAAMVEAKAPGTWQAWLQDAGSAVGAALLVWYVPNTPNTPSVPPGTAQASSGGSQAETRPMQAG